MGINDLQRKSSARSCFRARKIQIVKTIWKKHLDKNLEKSFGKEIWKNAFGKTIWKKTIGKQKLETNWKKFFFLIGKSGEIDPPPITSEKK